MADPMATQTSSPLPHFPTPPLKYEVFVSFRGLDTRKTFTDHLYKALVRDGIHTFRDEEKLESGKPISKELARAIAESQIFVVVLSRNYATSTWCLDELANMVELAANDESRLILPVFYDVTPPEVRKQTGVCFEEAFAKHEKDFEGETEKVTRYETELIGKIVEHAVKGIFLSSPKQEKVHLKKDTFLNMDDLKLLKIHNVIFSGCLESLSDELRFLEWHEYPLKLLPSSFEPENLVELHLPRSKIEKLWEEFEKPLEKLVILNLTDCEMLIETPDFGKVPNLEQLILKGCTSLSEVPDIINLRSLMTFILSGCSRIEKLSEIGEDMKQLKELHLDGTAIEVLPTSIKHLTGLTVLNLKDCNNLLCLPDIICTSLTSLQTLTISGCANLKELPENLGCLKCLQELDATGTAIKQLPASIKDLTRLSKLYLRYCKNLCSLPATICTSLTLLQILNLSGCSSLDELPENLGSLECLQELYAGGTAISEVPESISQLSQLGELVLDDCSKLQSWPRLPFSIRWDAIHRSTMLEYSYRSNKIPAWLSRQSTESSVTIPLPRDVDGISKWMGLALCFVCVAAQKHDNLEDEPEFDEKSQSNLTRNFRIDLYTTEDPHERPQVLNYGNLDFTGPFIHWLYIPRTGLEECSNKRFIRALITPDSPEVKVKECGASQINSEHVTTFVSKMITTTTTTTTKPFPTKWGRLYES
ncbi:hypothetical protein DVH24_005042 [Malus domestica]|uniref:TIR domain-containing protein n=1 Tax=Malus domestica TaxID=3750 RepID=A0A498IBI8_MALDO|nr:hypothetical protein DVH24_005042 [Malus domestica]